MAPDPDIELVAAARAGSRIAFSALIDRHQPAVRAFLRRVASNAEEADDLAQETFVTAWAQAPGWRGEAGVRTWLCAIAWRKARGARRAWFRSLARDGGYAERSALEQAGGGPDAADRLALAAAMAELPADQRAAVALCLAQDFSHAEAAQVLGLPLGTVKSHVQRGRAKLLSALGEPS